MGDIQAVLILFICFDLFEWTMLTFGVFFNQVESRIKEQITYMRHIFFDAPMYFGLTMFAHLVYYGFLFTSILENTFSSPENIGAKTSIKVKDWSMGLYYYACPIGAHWEGIKHYTRLSKPNGDMALTVPRI